MIYYSLCDSTVPCFSRRDGMGHPGCVPSRPGFSYNLVLAFILRVGTSEGCITMHMQRVLIILYNQGVQKRPSKNTDCMHIYNPNIYIYTQSELEIWGIYVRQLLNKVITHERDNYQPFPATVHTFLYRDQTHQCSLFCTT